MKFSKIWRKFSLKIYFSKKKKIFEMKYILRILSQILENPKNFIFSFSFP